MQTQMKFSFVPKRFAVAVFLSFFALLHASAAEGQEGFYLGGAAGGEYADAEYGKSVKLNLPGGKAITNRSGDSDKAGTSFFKAVLGHRWNLFGGAYLAGEIDAVLRLDNPVTGSIEGTKTPGNPDSDVFPGNWSMDKNRSFGFSVRLGYDPESTGFLGEGGSVYALAGLQRMGVKLETTATGTLSSGRVLNHHPHREKVSVTPWLFGGGVEIGGEKSRLDLRATYSRYDINYGSGDATAVNTPIVNYGFKVSEWGFYVGYTWSLGFGLGT